MKKDYKYNEDSLEFWDDSESLKRMIDNYKRQRKIRNFLIHCGDIQPTEADVRYFENEMKQKILNSLCD